MRPRILIRPTYLKTWGAILHIYRYWYCEAEYAYLCQHLIDPPPDLWVRQYKQPMRRVTVHNIHQGWDHAVKQASVFAGAVQQCLC